jgi:hypothetical protein
MYIQARTQMQVTNTKTQWCKTIEGGKRNGWKYNVIKQSKCTPQPLDRLAPNSMGRWGWISSIKQA